MWKKLLTKDMLTGSASSQAFPAVYGPDSKKCNTEVLREKTQRSQRMWKKLLTKDMLTGSGSSQAFPAEYGPDSKKCNTEVLRENGHVAG